MALFRLRRYHGRTATRSGSGIDRTRFARDSYSVIHLSLVGSIIFVALGIEQTLAHANESLEMIAAVDLYGAGGLYLFGYTAFRYRDHWTVGVLRRAVAIVACMAIP